MSEVTLTLKVKIDIPEGATHFRGNPLADPTWYKLGAYHRTQEAFPLYFLNFEGIWHFSRYIRSEEDKKSFVIPIDRIQEFIWSLSDGD